jgi:hypothetical protein
MTAFNGFDSATQAYLQGFLDNIPDGNGYRVEALIAPRVAYFTYYFEDYISQYFPDYTGSRSTSTDLVVSDPTVLDPAVSGSPSSDSTITPDSASTLSECTCSEECPGYSTTTLDEFPGSVSSGDGSLAGIAATQIGNEGGQPYWSWYGSSYRIEWCAVFVSWCADQLGYIEADILFTFASTSAGIREFKERGQWHDSSYVPAPDDLIFFDWEVDGAVNHVGIVEYVEDGRVYTIEGNSSDSVRRKDYKIDDPRIFCYAVPDYGTQLDSFAA